MKTFLPPFSFQHPAKWMLCLFIFLAGCATNAVHDADTAVVSDVEIHLPENSISLPPETSVIRYGRYRLVEIGAEGHQQDLLSQIIDLTIPALPHKPNPSVADAMRHVLLNSGYQLCHTESVIAFESFPLPVAHYRLGPISIRAALSVLAGSGWHLQVDDFNRKVCFMPIQATDHSVGNESFNEGGE